MSARPAAALGSRAASAQPLDAAPRTALLPARVARISGFIGLAGFAALAWADMVEPAASGALLGCVGAAALGGWLLTGVARRRARARARIAATLLVGAGLLLLALAVSGVPVRLLAPRALDDLAGGLGQGFGAVSTVRTPYSGLDEWTRIALVLSGCALVAVAALLAFVPRRGGAFGVPAAAAVALGALYTVPVMQHDIAAPSLAGLAFTLLLAVFLWLERVERRAAGPAVAIVAAAGLAAVVAAPALDRGRALLDYEELAQSLSPSATTTYRWDHDYGPLAWPRDGREVLRVRADRRAYWKAANLVAFDGRRWLQDGDRGRDRAETRVYDRRWVQTIRVTMRALRTQQFVGAGATLAIDESPRTATSPSPGTFVTTGSPLRRGQAYRAVVYSPQPTAAQLRAAPAAVPPGLSRRYALVGLPGAPLRTGPAVAVPWWGEAGPPVLLDGSGTDARPALDASPYGPVYALARRLRAGAATPLEYVRAVERHLADGFAYTETPPPSEAPLADFLLRDRAGFCQQFSGAMALLLRLGGVPARVASGFSPGSLDGDRREYVVRDIDAHSWVEVFVAGIGWVTRDPTPAASPARSQVADLLTAETATPATSGGSERTLGARPQADAPGAAAAAEPAGRGPGAPLLAAGGLAVLCLAAAALALALRRRRRPADDAHADAELGDLLRALRRSGRPPAPGLTLRALGERLGAPAAADYVQTLADARYGYGDARPTRAQRGDLRRRLGAGLGWRGRLRAWWALPPRLGRGSREAPAGRRARDAGGAAH